MRFIIIISFTILFSLTNGKNLLVCREEEFKIVHKECQSNSVTHVDEEVLAKFHNGEEVEDKNLALHIFCMNKKLNIQEEDGEINKDQIKRDLQNVYHTEGEINDIVEECGTFEGKTKYHVAKKVYKCLHKYANQIHNLQYREKRKHEYEKAVKECNKGAVDVDMKEQGEFLSGKNVDSPNLRKFILCFSKKIEWTINGELNEEVVEHDLQGMLHDKILKQIIKECSAISKDIYLEEDAKVTKTLKCIRDHANSNQMDEYKRSREQRDKFMKFHEECQADPAILKATALKADTEVVFKLVRGEEGEDVNDPELGYHILCINKKIGIQLENGDIDKESTSIKNYLKRFSDDEERITKVVNECAVKNEGDSEIVSALKIFKCLHQMIRHRGHFRDGPQHDGLQKNRLDHNKDTMENIKSKI